MRAMSITGCDDLLDLPERLAVASPLTRCEASEHE
jgi:hypothetical protein